MQIVVRRLFFISVMLFSLNRANAALAEAIFGHTPAARSFLLEKLKTFGNQTMGDYIRPHDYIKFQIVEGLSNSEIDVDTLPGGYKMYSGSRWQSGYERAAMIVSPKGRAEAAAVIHFHTHYGPKDAPRGRLNRREWEIDGLDPKLAIFLRQDHPQTQWRPVLEAWSLNVEKGRILPAEIVLVH